MPSDTQGYTRGERAAIAANEAQKVLQVIARVRTCRADAEGTELCYLLDADRALVAACAALEAASRAARRTVTLSHTMRSPL